MSYLVVVFVGVLLIILLLVLLYNTDNDPICKNDRPKQLSYADKCLSDCNLKYNSCKSLGGSDISCGKIRTSCSIYCDILD